MKELKFQQKAVRKMVDEIIRLLKPVMYLPLGTVLHGIQKNV